MDTFSMMDDDPTLPIDFDQSTNLMRYLAREKKDGIENFQKSLLGNDESISVSESDSKPGSARNKANSPDRATMRDHEEIIGAYKKENFGLKLRIYFLEERLQMAYEGDTEDILKTNIELKVSIEQLKKDLSEKQQLLVKASKAMETISVESEKHINKLKEEFINQFNEMRDQLQEELNQREKDLIENHNQLEELNEKLLETEKLKHELEGYAKNSKPDPGLFEEIQLKQKEVEEKFEKEIQEKDLKINELMEENTAVELKNKDLQDAIKNLASQSPDRSNKHYEALYNNLMTENTENEKKLKEISKELRTKTNLVQELKDYINKTDRVNKELRNSVHDKETEKHRSSMSLQEHIRWKLNNKLRDLLYSVRLDIALSNKEKEVSRYRGEVEKLESLLKELQAELDSAKLKLKEIDSASNKDKSDALAASLADLQEKDFILKKNQQVLEDKEKDLKYFNNSKLRAEQELQNAIAQKNSDIQALSNDLRTLASENKERLRTLEDHYQQLQENAQTQLNKKDKLIQRLSNAVRSKDSMIQELATPPENLDTSSEGFPDNHPFIIQKLRAKIKELDHSIEANLDDKFNAINEKDQQLLEMKRAIRTKDREIDGLKTNISTCEDGIKHLENLGEEKDKSLLGLKAAIEMQGNAFKVSTETANNSIEDCQIKVMKLTSLLNAKEKEDTNKEQEANAEDPSHQKMIKDLTSERDAAFHRNETNRKKFISVLNENDLHLKDLFKMVARLSEEKNSSIKQLRDIAEHRKQDITAGDKKLVEAQKEFDINQQMCRQIEDEKDAIIQDLVKSGQEKDRLIAELHEHLQLSSKAAKADGNAEGERFKEMCNELKDRLNNKEEEVKALEAEVKQLRSDLERLKGSENIEITLKFDHLKDELESKEIQLRETRNEVEELKREKDEIHDKIQGLQSDKIKQMKQVEELIKFCEDKDMELQNIQSQLNFSKDVQETLKKLQEQKMSLEERLKDLHSEASSLKSSKESVEKKLSEATDVNGELKMELEDLKSKQQSLVPVDEVNRLRDEIQQLKSELGEDRLLPKTDAGLAGRDDQVDSSDLRELLKQQLQQQNELLNALEQEKQRYQDLASELKYKNQSPHKSHQKDLEFELESVSALRSQYEEGLRQNEALREHLEREVESVRGSLQNQEKSTTESELVKLSGQLEESERWNRSLQSRLDQMSPRSGGVGGSRDQTDSGSRNSFPAEITVMVEKLQNERDDLQERLRLQQAECSLLRKELRDGGSESNKAKASLAEFKQNYEQFSELRSKEMESLTNNCNEAKGVIRNMEKEISALNAELEQQHKLQNHFDNEAAIKQMQQIDELNDVLRKELNEKAEELQFLQQKIKSEEEMNRKLKSNCENISKDRNILMQQIEGKNSELNSCRETIKNLKRDIDAIEKQKNQLGKQLKDQNQLHKDRDELRALNERLRNKLGEVSKTYENLKDANDNEMVTLNEELKKAKSKICALDSDNEEANAIMVRLKDEIRKLQEESRNVERLTGELRNCQNINKVLQRQLNDVAKASELRQTTLDPELELIKHRMREFQRLNSDLEEKLRDCDRQEKLLRSELVKEKNKSSEDRDGFEIEMQKLANELVLADENRRSLETQVKDLSYIAESYKAMIERLEEQNSKKDEMTSMLEKELTRRKLVSDTSTSMTPQKTANFLTQTTPTKLQSESQQAPDVTLHEAVQKRDAYIAALRQQLEFYKHERENMQHAKADQAKEKTDNLIAMHIAEMRELRRELEQSIRNNDALRTQLEHRLSQAEKEAAQFKDPQMRASLLRENDSLRARIHEKETKIKNLETALEKAEKSKEQSPEVSYTQPQHQQIRRKDLESTRLDFEQMQKFAPQETSSALNSPLSSISAFTQTTPSKVKLKRNQETQIDTYATQIAAEKRELLQRINVFRETLKSKDVTIISLEKKAQENDAAQSEKKTLQLEVEKLSKSLSDKQILIQSLESKIKNLEESRSSFMQTESETQTTRGFSDSQDPRRIDKNSTNNDLIALHISEMRELKKELELSIRNNDALRSQLEHRLQMVERDAEYIKDPQLRVHVIRDNDILRTQSIERQNIVTRQKAKIDELLKEKQTDKEKLKNLHQQIHDLNTLTSNLQQEVGLYDRLQEQLNATVAKNKTVNCSPGKEAVKEDNANAGFDASLLQMLLEEIRILRTQLQKSIDANIALREKLEQQLEKPLSSMTPNSSGIEQSTAGVRVMLDPRSATIRRTLFQSDTTHEDADTDRFGSKDISRFTVQETPTKENGSPGANSSLLSPVNLEAVFHESKGHQVFVRGKIEDYISLKNKLANCCQRVVLMQDLHAVLQMHRTVNASQMNDLRAEVDKISLDMKECRQLLDAMWIDELPKADENADGTVIVENQQLRGEVINLKKKLAYQDRLIKSSLQRLEESNKVKGDLEQKILDQLKTTHGTMMKATQNLEDKIVKAKTPTK